MKRILIIGIVASGKTTLAKRLSKEINIACYELDSIVYDQTNEGRVKRTPEEQRQVILDIDNEGEWIFEGIDRSSYRFLFDLADTILFLDPPLWKRKIRIFTRFLKQNLGIEKCQYKSDFKMLKMMYKWTKDFEDNRPVYLLQLDQYKDKLLTISDNKNLNLYIEPRGLFDDA